MSFQKHIRSEVLPRLAKELSIENPMQLPRLEKIVLNMGVGSHVAQGNKDLSSLKSDMSMIAGQLPYIALSRKAISNFKLRQGMPVGIAVTLRGERMYAFLEKLVKIILPRVRDFRGISSKSFDKDGNFSFGLKEHTIFPEVPQTDVVKAFGMQITMRFKSSSKKNTKAFLDAISFPFAK